MGDHEHSHSKHLGTDLCVNMCFHVLRNGVSRSHGKKLPNCFRSWLCHLALTPAVGPSGCSASSPAVAVLSLFNVSRSAQCVVVAHVVLIGVFLAINDAEQLFKGVSTCELL